MFVAGQITTLDDPYADYHEACFAYDERTMWRIYVTRSGTTFTKTTDSTTTTQTYAALAYTADGDWPAGATFANTMADTNFFPIPSVRSATWKRDLSTRVDTLTFARGTDGAETKFLSTVCANWGNCRYAGSGTGAKHCFDDVETCCGWGTMTPKCVPKNSNKQCCQHFLASTTCDGTQTCCGMLGTGASSFAFCCNAGSTCCKSRGTGNGVGTCCPGATTCCQAGSIGLCCQSDEVCEPLMNTCRKLNTNAPAIPTTTYVPETVPATLAPTTAALPSTTAESETNAPETPRTSTRTFLSTTPMGNTTTADNTSTSTPLATTHVTNNSIAPGTTTTTTTTQLVTAAPSTTVSVPGEDSDPPPSISGVAWFTVHAAITIPGSSFGTILADAAATQRLSDAVVRDLARLLHVSASAMLVESLTAGSLVVIFRVLARTTVDAAGIAAVIASLPSSHVIMSQTTVEYRAVNPTATELTVTSAKAASDSNIANAGPSSLAVDVRYSGSIIVSLVALWVTLAVFE
jgi:hypothetical protein